MSIYSNVTEQDLDNLRKLAEQQKEQRAIKIRNKILKQTHELKLAESFSPITKNLDETSKKLDDTIKESTQNLENVINENITPKPAIENTPTIQPATENTQTQPGVLYEVSLENTLTNMKDKEKGFLKITEDENVQRFWNGIPVEISSNSGIEIKGKYFNITPNLGNVFTDTTGKSLKKLDKTETTTYKQLLKTPNYRNYKHKSGEKNSGRYKSTNNLLVPIIFQVRGIEKIIIASNIIDIYTRLEIFLGLKLSGHSNTLTEASSIIDQLYKLGEIQNKQQYQNALDKFTTN